MILWDLLRQSRRSKRNKTVTFSPATKKQLTVTNKNGKSKAAAVNRDFLSALLNFQIKTGNMVDFEKALCHSLSPVPLSISHPDGTKRKTAKNKLKDVIFKECPEVREKLQGNGSDNVVVDMMAVLNTIAAIPKTYALLADKFVRALPKNYARVDIVADTYQDETIKAAEQKSRGESEKIHSILTIQSTQ